MKNNRLTNKEIIELRMIVDRIRELASLENAKFGCTEEFDIETKKRIKPYMFWFSGQASKLQQILDGTFEETYF